MLNAEVRQTPRQTTADFPKLGKRPGKRGDKKQEIIFNHLIKKKEFIMANESKVAQVGTIDLHSLTNDAHFIYMKDVENVIEEDEGAKNVARIQTAVKALKEAVKEEDERLILSKKSQYTEQIAAKDRERDSIFRGYRTAVKGMLRMPVAKMAEAAADLWQHLKDYNIDPDMQLERETSRMMNLVADLDYKLAPQVQLLGLKPYVDALRAANDTVEELLATRTDDRSQQIAGALRKARLASDAAYLDTVRLINAMAVVGTEKSLTPLINYLNANIKRYKEQVMTRGKKKDDDRPEKYGDDNTTTARTADTLTAADENS